MKEIADGIERQAFWTHVMRSDNQNVQHRLKASELLGKVQGDFDSEWIDPEADNSAQALTDEELLRIVNRDGLA